MAHSSALFKPAADSKKTNNFATFKSMIAAHFSYLMQHHKFITRIENGEIKDDKEIDEYLDEVIGASYKKSIHTRKKCIEIIHHRLLKKIEIFKSIYLLTFEEPSDVNLITLIYIMDYTLKTDNFFKKFEKMGLVNVNTLIDSVFDNVGQITDMRRFLKHLMPASFAQIAKGITIEVQGTMFSGCKEASLSQVETTTYIKYDWAGLMSNYPQVLSQAVTGSIEMLCMIADLRAKKEIFKGRIRKQLPEPKTLSEKYRNHVELLKSRIEAGLEALKALKEFQTSIDEAKVAEEQKKKATFATEALWPKVIVEIKKLEKQLQITTDILAEYFSPEEVKDILAEITEEIALLNTIVEASDSYSFDTAEEVEDIEAQFEEEKKSLYEWMTEIAKEAQEEIKQTTPIDTKRLEEKPIKVTPSAPGETAAAFKSRQADATKIWKEQVEKSRQEKVAEKGKCEVTGATPPLSPKEEKEKSVDPVITQFLMSLKPKKMQLVRDILNHNTSLKYDKIYFLIKRLGGEITSTGTSGSHRRVRIGAAYTELLARDYKDPDQHQDDSDSDEATEAKAAASVATSSGPTMFATTSVVRPHKRKRAAGHNPKTLSRCNVELLAKGLTDAGITLALLDKIDELKVSAATSVLTAGHAGHPAA